MPHAVSVSVLKHDSILMSTLLMRTVAYTITRTVCGSSNKDRAYARVHNSNNNVNTRTECVIYNCMNIHMFMHTALGKYARKGKALYTQPVLCTRTLVRYTPVYFHM